MGFKFHEIMRGTFRSIGNPESERGFHFEIDSIAESLPRFVKDFMTEIKGTITVAGIAHEKPLWGTLEIAILTKKILEYNIYFTGNDGDLFRLVGTKNIEYKRIVQTMTHGSVEIYRNGKKIGEGEMFFDLKDLPAFLLSMRYA